jgi:hypothetical protein
METFLFIMVAGLVGLLLMALPGMQQHGHVGGTTHIAPPAHGGVQLGHGAGAQGAAHALPGAHTGHAIPHAGGQAAAHTAAPGGLRVAGSQAAQQGTAGAPQNAEATGFEFTRLIPSPRAVFSILTLFGAFGYALGVALHSWQLAALLAIVPAWGIEHFAVRPLWDLLFRFQGKPSTPIEALVTCEAKAVTPFHNGKGLVSVEHDGRVVQFSARLHDAQANVPVQVGDTLCVEDVDSANQRVLVSIK